jgi:roadblock/LC7 domain-containing protein
MLTVDGGLLDWKSPVSPEVAQAAARVRVAFSYIVAMQAASLSQSAGESWMMQSESIQMN